MISILTSFSLWYALKSNTVEILLILSSIRWYRVFIVVGVVLFCQLIVGWILKQFSKMVKKDYSLKEGVINALVASFFHGITPSASGGQFAQVFVFYKQGVAIEQSISILIMDFIVYQIAMLLVSLVLLIWKISYIMNRSIFILGIIGFCINAFIILMMFLGAFSTKANQWIMNMVIRVLAFLHIVKDVEMAKLNMKQKLEDFAKGLTLLCRNKILLLKVLIANIFRLIVFFSIPILCCWALNIPVLMKDVGTMIALTSFIMNVNACVPIPGASGSTESVFLIMFGILLSQVEVSSVMVLWRFLTYHLILVIGGFVFIRVQKGESL